MLRESDLSRTRLAARNTAYVLVQRGLYIALAFANRSAFIYMLGFEYLGVQGLFMNVITVLNFADLGLGSAISVLLYRPLANGDDTRSRALVRLYGRVYAAVGALVVVLGLALMPALPHLILNYGDVGVDNLAYVYVLVLLNTALSYIGASKRALLTADQRDYVSVRNQMVFGSLTQVIQIVVLAVWRDFVVYLWVAVVFTLLSNVSITAIAKRRYPTIAAGARIPVPLGVGKDIRALASAGLSHRVGQAVIVGTDNVVISRFIGLLTTGVYANYLMITTSLDGVLSAIALATIPGLGNLYVTGDPDSAYGVFERLYYLFRWVYVTAAVVLFCTLNRFIVLWTQGENVFGAVAVGLIVANFYWYGMRRAVEVFMMASGLHMKTRFRPIWEAVVNLGVSLVAVQSLGVAGVFAGTLVGYLSGSVWYDPSVLFRDWFKKPVRPFLRTSLADFLITVLTAGVAHSVTNELFARTLGGLVLTTLVSLSIATLVLLLLHGRSPCFEYYRRLLVKALARRTAHPV